MSAITQLPLDLKGTKVSNRIQNESRTMIRVDGKPHRVVLPRFGAFFDESLKLYDGARPLVFGVDYTTTYLYRELTELTTKAVYAFIVIINAAVSNTIVLNYQAVGGNFGVNANELEALLDAVNPDNFRADWEDVVNKPTAFNAAEHHDEYWQLYGCDNTITVLNRVRDLLEKNDEAIVQELEDYTTVYFDQAKVRLEQEKELFRVHAEDMTNPHADDKTKLGLGNVQNWRMVLASESLNAALDQYYSTPESGLKAINEVLIPLLNAHVGNFNNPHGTRAIDVGAYSNSEIATRLDQRLNKQDPAYNSAKIFGYTRAQWKTYCNANLKSDQVTQGLFGNAVLGGGTANSQTLLMGDGNWKSYVQLIQEMDAVINRNKIIAVRVANAGYNATTAINYLNTNFGNVAVYPVGSKAVFTGYNAIAGHTTWNTLEVKFLIRQAGGWAAWLL